MIGLQAKRSLTVGLGGQRTQCLAQFLCVHAGHEADRADVMLVQGVRETTQDGLIGIRRHAVDD